MVVQMTDEMVLAGRLVGSAHRPLVIAEIGINHEGSIEKAIRMVDDAARAGCECAKFQSHVIEDEMIPNNVIPGNAKESIWQIMSRCALSEEEERQLKSYVESKGMIFLCTPFSRAAAIRLQALEVPGFKIGSGECNNYPLIELIASYGKPVIMSTGMNDIASIRPPVDVFRKHKTPFALLHCTSIYPIPYKFVRLQAIEELRREFATALVGLSDHSIGNYTCFGAVALGACILEKHFTSDKSWPGPDVPISLDPVELADLIQGSDAIFEARHGTKSILREEQPTIDFAYACVVTTKAISAGEVISRDNIWVKRPGTGAILAKDFDSVLGKQATRNLSADAQLAWNDFA